MPVNGLLIRALLNLYQFYGDDFKVECPTGSGKYMTLFEVAKEIARRVSNIFLRDANGKRPVYGGTKKFQDDPTGETISCSTSISMATMGPVLVPVIKLDGRDLSRVPLICLRV